ncbi:MAG: serine/threonine-protein kinase [Phycisphaerales bacterium]|nr:serine/threonine-protein kinase [Phycisphaerales bacterium]
MSDSSAGDLNKRVSQTAPTVVTKAEPALVGIVGSGGTAALEPAGVRIGDYTVIRVIGTGGMGVVYEAEQQNPRRVVALKVMRAGIASPAVLRRFEYEAQLLARLRHPGIAQIYEAGTHAPDAGTLAPGMIAAPIQYYAMEMVPDARTLTEHARAMGLGVRERMELFAKVCDAVHHGHSKGVIHRDLKPANILVDVSSGAAQPKVIDFGVARSQDAGDERTMQTQAGVLIGTPQYMSPEQIAADPNAIDTRSDVYALGLILYELLSNKLPYELAHLSLHEAARVVREYTPTRLSRVTAGGTTGVGGGRVGGDIETIVSKALEKSPDRRYQSAADLAADIRRFLNNEPISARPPSVTYQLRVLARRHKAIAAGVVIGVLGLLGAVGLSTAYAQSEQAQRHKAEDARNTAQQQFVRAQRVTQYLKEMLTTVDPRQAQGKEPTVRDLLEVAAEKAPTSLKDDPVSCGNVQVAFGQTYYQLGEYEKARKQFIAAHENWSASLGPENVETLNARSLTGITLAALGKPDEAEAVFREALAGQTKALGIEHPDTLATMSNLALVLQDQGKLDDAERFTRESLEIKKRVMGAGDPEVLATMMNLADLLQTQGKLRDALAQARAAAEACERHLGPKHPSTLMARSILASALDAVGEIDEALTVVKDVIATRSDVLGPGHPDTLTSRNLMSILLDRAGKSAEAEALARENLKQARERLGADHPTSLTYQSNLANFLRTLAEKAKETDSPRLTEAKELLVDAIAKRTVLEGPDAVGVQSARNNLAIVLENQGKFDEAEAVHRSVILAFDRTLPADHFLRFAARKNLGECLVDSGKLDEAEPMLLSAYDDLKRVLGADQDRTRGAAKALEKLYTMLAKPNEATKWAELAKPPTR